MIVFVTTAHHGHTVAAFADGRFGHPVPTIVQRSYESLWAATEVPAATYILADICQSARKRDPGSACKRDPLLVCLDAPGLAGAEP